MSEDGFALFFRQRYPKTVLLLMMGVSRADAEDAAQEAMTSAWRQWEDIRKPAAWVRTAALRALWKYDRQQLPSVPLEEAAPQLATSEPDLAIFADEQRWVLSLLRRLAPEQRAVAALFYDGLTVGEIAALTSKPPSTVRSHLRHARRSLKEMIMPDHLSAAVASP